MSFYMILPSNSCPDTQVKNMASSYIVDWQTMIQLSGKWEVALTEYSFDTIIKNPSLIPTLLYHTMTPMQITLQLNINSDEVLYVEKVPFFNYKGPVIFYMSSDKIIAIKGETAPFSITFKTIQEADSYGFESLTNHSDGYLLIAKYFCKFDPGVNIQLDYLKMDEASKTIIFDKYSSKLRYSGLKKYLVKKLSPLVKHLDIDNDGVLSFELANTTYTFQFDKHLAKNLGFLQKFKYYRGATHIGMTPCHLNRLNKQIYIYSSIVDPILVGGIKVPLLKVVWIKNNLEVGGLNADSIENYMYLPVSSTSINNIEVELRDDSGELTHFSYGAKSSITLHFRKYE